MSNTIASQTWMMIEEVNGSLQSQQKAQKQGEARIALQNSSILNIADLQQFEKDSVLAKGIATDKLSIPNPTQKWNGFQGLEDQQPGLISIIGSVLCIQARMNSNFWSTLWKQASQSMMMEVKFAPIIGNAIKTAYQAQSNATSSQADQAQADGFISLSMFIIGIGVGAYADFKAPEEENPLNAAKKEVGFTKENAPQNVEDTEANANKLVKNENAAVKTESVDSKVDDMAQKQDTAFSTRAKKFGQSAKSAFTRGQKRLTSLLGKTAQYVQMFALMSEGTTKLNDVKYQNAQAAYQSTEGGAQALSKEAEQYAQFYGQDFSRQEDLRQGAGQNLDYAMNILKSAADSITQTVTSMFRG